MTSHITSPQGNRFPLANLKGKDYLEVKYRIQLLREEHPEWSIQTACIHHDTTTKHAVFRAEVVGLVKVDDVTVPQVISTAHGSETAKDFADYLEKAETKAVGRALGYAGYGTLYTGQELDEGSRIVDAPVEPLERNTGHPRASEGHPDKGVALKRILSAAQAMGHSGDQVKQLIKFWGYPSSSKMTVEQAQEAADKYEHEALAHKAEQVFA